MTTADGAVIGTTQIFGSAPRNRAFNVVLLADGFKAAQQAAFDSACGAFVSAFRATPPYDELSSAINVFRVNVRSTDSGADDPTSGGGTGATARTYFDASFGANGIRRLLVCDDSTALQTAAAQVPQFTVVLVVVNSLIYGGSGGSVGTYSLASGATEIAIHEMGHTAYGLADEYAYYAGGNEPGQDHYSGSEPTEPNVTASSHRATLKWRWAVAAATAVPTMSNPSCSQVDSRPSPVAAGTPGLFEGAYYVHCGAFRAEYDCKMRNLGVPFCAVCRQVIRNRIGPLVTLQGRDRTPISAVARASGQLDVFAAASDGRTMSDWWDQHSGWAGWFQISGGVASPGGAGSPITAAARSPAHLDVFTVGTDDHVYTAWWDAADGWSAWGRLGSMLCRPGSTVNVVARSPSHLDVFTTAADGRTIWNHWDASSGWASWSQVPGGVAAGGATVTAISRDPSRLDLFTVGMDNLVLTAWWDAGSGWHAWAQLGDLACRADSTVSVVARTRDHLDLFTTAADGRIMSNWWTAAGGWGSWGQVAGGVASPGSPVTAISRSANQIDLFVIGADNRINTTWWHDPGGWASWSVLAGGVGKPGGQVAAVSRDAGHLDLFTVAADGIFNHTSWDTASGWAPWARLGVS
jgi:IgA Peptidase M64